MSSSKGKENVPEDRCVMTAPPSKEVVDKTCDNTHVPRLNLVVDPIFMLITSISLASRFYNISHPYGVVFDEIHYIKFISLYAKRIFFFDPQPPLGKQLLTLSAYLSGFQGDLSYSQIGDPYKPNFPAASIRALPCLAGSAIAPLVYLIGLELGYRQYTATLASVLIITENALLTQSRFILPESMSIILSLYSVYCYLKFARRGNSIKWLCIASASVTLSFCIKYSALYTYTLLLGLIGHYWWSLLDKLDIKKLIKTTTHFVICLLILPALLYISIYYIHLSWLTKAGPHDSIMTSAFQASLENGLASITRGQPLEVVHGSQITLRHTHGRSCWLHSHEHLYPVKYSDNRGSSHQQQVTCYSFKDVNNWWIVKRPHIDELVVTEPRDIIKDGDIIQLVHGLTGRLLNSHDVASAMSPYSQEVSCYVDHNISMVAQETWRVRLVNPEATNSHWHTMNSRLKLLHMNSSLALKFSGRQLPEWGFHQHEIVADKDISSADTIWNVEEHRYTKSEDQKEREQQLGQAEFVPLEPTSLTFFEKFTEIHTKLFTYHQDAIKDHLYACESPIDWVFYSKGTAYWIDGRSQSNAQIFLIGNVHTGKVGLLSLAGLLLVLFYYLIRRRRKITWDFTDEQWLRLQKRCSVLLGGYLVHLVPYFAYESPLFFQFYLMSLIFKILSVGAIIDYLHDAGIPKFIPHAIAIATGALSLDIFVKLSPLSYGSGLSREEVENLRWKDTWQLITVTS